MRKVPKGVLRKRSSTTFDNISVERGLVKRLRRGDKAALRELYENAFGPLYQYVFFRADENHEVAEDIVHDTFLEAVKSLKNFSPGKGTLQAWLRGIARNLLSA